MGRCYPWYASVSPQNHQRNIPYEIPIDSYSADHTYYRIIILFVKKICIYHPRFFYGYVIPDLPAADRLDSRFRGNDVGLLRVEVAEKLAVRTEDIGGVVGF